MTAWRRIPFHILFFASFPILALAAANSGQLRLGAIWRPLAVSLALGFFLWLILSWLTRDRLKAAVLVSLGSILFFSYGHIYEWAQRAEFLDGGLGRHRYLLPVWLVLLAITVVAVRRLRRPLDFNWWLNSVGVILILMPLMQLGVYEIQSRQATRAHASGFIDPASGETISLETATVKPDVYFIVLDAYARSDVLVDSWGIDNSEFLDQLEELGFQVASCSQSNYSQTELAFASTLNMAYLDDLGEKFVANRDDRTPLRPLIKHSLVRRLLEDQGYQTVAFETGYPFSEIEDADVYIAPRVAGLSGGLSGFEGLLLRTSAGLILLDAHVALPRILVPAMEHSVVQHRQRTVLALETLADSDQFEGPTFVFAHIVSPHRPFIFGPGPGGTSVVSPTFDGSEAEKFDWYRQGYADQIAYLNQRMLSIIENLIEHSDHEPVIILQGDHGPEEGSSQDRMRILNAYYLPEAEPGQVYPQISPVNTFRLVFDQTFGADLSLLADKSYFSTYNRPYDYSIVNNPGCQSGEG